MSCYHMNVTFVQKDALIKKNKKIGDFKHRIIFSNSPEFRGYEWYMEQNKKLEAKGEPYTYKLIPCGKCIGCRTQERKNWTLRIEKEAKKYKHNYFITLTYNDENIEIPDKWTDPDGKEYYNDGTWTGTLKKEHLQQFIKSLRQWFKRDYFHKGTRFYACGEYGEKTQRPHYHIILLNCPELELKPIGTNPKTKHCYYTNERIEQIWHKGFIQIGEVNWDTISYTAGYTMKKLFGEINKNYYASRGQIPIFANMSRRPGIGKEWFNENCMKIYDYDEIINSKGQAVKPPRYFDKLMEQVNEDYINAIKRKRQIVSERETKKELSQTTKTLKEINEIKERTALDKQRHYNRGRIKENVYT